MNIELTSKSVNQMANRILEAYPHQAKPAILEMLACGLGYRNFDTLSGVLKKEKPTAKQGKGTRLPPHSLSAPVMLWLECFSVEDGMDAPQWVNYQLTSQCLQVLLEKQAMCVSKDLEVVKFCEEPSAYDQGFFVADIPNWSMFVSKTCFWFRGFPKHCDYAVETAKVEIAELLAMLMSRIAVHSGFNWVGSQLYHDSQDANALWAMTVTGDADPGFAGLILWAACTGSVSFKDSEPEVQDEYVKEYLQSLLVDQDDVAEWVGLHYHQNYSVGTEAIKLAWTKRYLDAMKPSSM
jgi:hypothetical protein